jgi:hypothetical protein
MKNKFRQVSETKKLHSARIFTCTNNNLLGVEVGLQVSGSYFDV